MPQFEVPYAAEIQGMFHIVAPSKSKANAIALEMGINNKFQAEDFRTSEHEIRKFNPKESNWQWERDLPYPPKPQNPSRATVTLKDVNIPKLAGARLKIKALLEKSDLNMVQYNAIRQAYEVLGKICYPESEAANG